MKDWKKILVVPSASIEEAIRVIDAGAMQIALVVNENHHLLGTVTDGDVRGGILKGLPLSAPVQQIMNPDPTTARFDESKEAILALMKRKKLHQIPVIDEKGEVVGVEILDELIQPQVRDNWVVLMAGGLGSRLRPLTDDCPKPLLKVGSKPIMETILDNFIEYGYRRFFLSVNYKAEMIQDYFGDGSKWGVEIRYLHEKERMGTAGALGLLPEKPLQPILVMNGDLLTKVNFQHLLNFHQEHQAKATMCVREYEYQVPYGVVKIDHQRLVGIEEKPVQHYFVSAGIYVLEPEVLELIPSNAFFDMPTLFQNFWRRMRRLWCSLCGNTGWTSDE